MAVERKLNPTNYAVPAGPHEGARRVYPIDQYDLERKLSPASLFRDVHILKVPILGQRGHRRPDGTFVDDWCGRTSASTLYNWFQLVKGGDPKDRYITHWDAGDPTYHLNLRTPDKRRIFYAEPEKQPGNGDPGRYGSFKETWKELLKKPYQEGHIFPLTADTRQRAQLAAQLTQAQIEAQLAPVLGSLRLNNPVFLYSGFTKGRNHLILIVGYAHILDPRGEPELWLAIADPATPAGWLAAGTVLDLTKEKAELSQLTAAHDAILIVKGEWDERRGTLVLVRARFLFRRKGDYPAYVKAAADAKNFKWKAKNYDDFNAKNALFLDDVGNPGKAGGYIFYSTDASHAALPEGAALVTQARCAFPFEIQGVAAAPIPMLHHHESRSVDLGGFYPLGLHDNLHGGVHFSTKDVVEGEGDLVPVRAMAPGRIVAVRLPVESATPDAGEDEKKSRERRDLALELSGNTPHFVLVRHELESVPKKEGEEPKRWVFHGLYMHLAAPPPAASFGKSAYRKTPWLAALHREKNGALTVVDPDAQSLGAHLWPAAKPGAEIGTADVAVVDPATYAAKTYEAKPPKGGKEDDRVRLVAKPPEAKLVDALKALAGGTMLTFAEPHPNLFVSGGTNIGWTSRRAAGGRDGFLHWEILSPPGKEGLEGLAQAAKELLAGEELFPLFAETKPNNVLDKDEEAALRDRLPPEDRKKSVLWGDLSQLSFAGADAKKGIEPDPALRDEHYYLRLDVSSFQQTVAAGPRTLSLTFRGAGQKEELTTQITVNEGEAFKTVQAPGWASTVEITSAGVMVRARTKAPEAADVSAHLQRITKHRFRNLLLRHMNGWSEKTVNEELAARFAGDEKLKKLVEAVCFWGDPEHPLYTDQKLGGGDLKDTPKLDNLHPVVALWVLDLLLERGLVRFVAPSVGKAQPVEPLAKAWLPIVPSRSEMPAGSAISAMVVSNRWRTSDVEAKLEAVSGEIRVPISQGRYQDGNLAGTVDLSAWGELDLVLSHKDGGDWAEQGVKHLGAPKIKLAEPKLAVHQTGPVPVKGGTFVWDLEFDDNCPRTLAGYLLAETRIGEKGDFELVDLVHPVVATQPPSGVKLTWEKGFLVGAQVPKGENDVVVAPGTTWNEVVAAAGKLTKGEKPRIARKLLFALGKLEAAYREKVPKGHFRLVAGTLRAEGCCVDVAALATKEKGKAKTDHHATLLEAANEIAKRISGLKVADDTEHPGRVTLSVDQKPDDTPSGALQVVFDPRAFLGQILAAKKPAIGEVLEVRFLLRFYNGGHVVELTGSQDCGPDGSCSDIAAVEPKAPSTIDNPALPDVRSGGVDAKLALPHIVDVRWSTDAGGLRLTARLEGGDLEFWKAAKPAFEIDGTPKVGAIADGKTLTATFTPKEVGKDGFTQLAVKTLAAGAYAGAEIAAGAVPVKFAEGVPASLAAFELSGIEVKPSEDGYRFTVTAKGPRVPLSVTFTSGKSTYRPVVPDAGGRLTAGPDDVARGRVDVGKLGKSKKPRTFTIAVTATWDGEIKTTDTWTYPSEEASQ